MASAGASAAHVHGLGINPGDGALFIATHGGLFRSAEGTAQSERVGDTAQDTMGFTITGPDQFLGSGHPAPDQGGPPSLGLIRSADAGASWAQVSLAGEADFHVLRSAGQRVYGYDGLSGKLMVSEDGGVSWESREPPAAIIDLAIDPDDPDRLLAATELGVALSEDGADTWKPLSADIGLLAWPSEGRVYLVDAAGSVKLGDAEGSWKAVGEIGGQPVALAAAAPDRAFAALADGRVLESNDGGSSWELRVDLAQPPG